MHAIPEDMAESRNNKARIGEFQNGLEGIAPKRMPVYIATPMPSGTAIQARIFLGMSYLSPGAASFVRNVNRYSAQTPRKKVSNQVPMDMGEMVINLYKFRNRR